MYKMHAVMRLIAKLVYYVIICNSDPRMRPLNASNDSKKAIALQPEKVCTVIAIKECIWRSVQMSKVTATSYHHIISYHIKFTQNTTLENRQTTYISNKSKCV